MFGRRLPLFRLAGIPVRADFGWIILAVLIAWSLAVGVFPMMVPQRSTLEYALLGTAGAIALFASILLHELSHALVARRDGVPTHAITLWIFGGVAETTTEPRTPGSELRVALAGPACSALLAGVCMAIAWALESAGYRGGGTALVAWIGWTNLLLAVFNLLPGLPLDGGRVLRAGLWRVLGDFERATHAASLAGQALGIVLIGGGVLFALTGQLLGGLWWVLIGSFLRRAAAASEEQVAIRRLLERAPVFRLMDRHPLAATPSETLARVAEDYAWSRGPSRIPVVEGLTLVGYLDVADLRGVRRQEWATRTAASLARAVGPEDLIDPGATGAEALRRMQDRGIGLLFVVEEDRLQGVVGVDDLARVAGMREALQRRGPFVPVPP